MTNTSPSSHSSLADTAPETNLPAPRLRFPDRTQLTCQTIDELIPADHLARDVWRLVEEVLDVTPLEDQIKSRVGSPGCPATAPQLLVALWIYAHMDQVLHGRKLDRMCLYCDPYKWLRGGVSVNYHTLCDFRKDHGDWLNDQLALVVARMQQEELIDWEEETCAQDGMRVRANAGSSSMRSGERLLELLEQAREHLEELPQSDGFDQLSPGSQAARLRAAREQVEHLEQAREARQEVFQTKENRKKGDGKQARGSVTDPQCRKMKMANGGFRPAYNVQLATLVGSLVVVGVMVTNEGTDANEMGPMMDYVQQVHQQQPRKMLGDGGFSTQGNIQAMADRGIPLYAPLKLEAKRLEEGKDPYAPNKRDSRAMAQWREGMRHVDRTELCRERGKCELPNAYSRNQGLRQFPVRGLEKVCTEMKWMVLAYNLRRLRSLRMKKQNEV